MAKINEIWAGVYQVGGNRLSFPEDCCVYLVQGNQEAVLIDAGAGKSADFIIENMEKNGIELAQIKTIIATHGHIDHIGGLKKMQERLGARVVAHELELPAIEDGLPQLTAAAWYRVEYQKVKVDQVLKQEVEKVEVGGMDLFCVHTPGHTPGGISIYCDIDGKRVLFGQDIHGPFNQEWGSNMSDWRKSMQKLLDLEADILCEGHFGIYSPAAQVRKYIEGYLWRFK